MNTEVRAQSKGSSEKGEGGGARNKDCKLTDTAKREDGGEGAVVCAQCEGKMKAGSCTLMEYGRRSHGGVVMDFRAWPRTLARSWKIEGIRSDGGLGEWKRGRECVDGRWIQKHERWITRDFFTAFSKCWVLTNIGVLNYLPGRLFSIFNALHINQDANFFNFPRFYEKKHSRCQTKYFHIFPAFFLLIFRCLETILGRKKWILFQKNKISWRQTKNSHISYGATQ